jgi:hypothetical protein
LTFDKCACHASRQYQAVRYRLLRDAVAETVAAPADIDAELRHLLSALAAA